jgi:uncharacterized membrane protein
VTIYLLALLIGVVAGSRAMLAPTAVSWAAHFGWITLSGTPLAFLDHPWARWILLALAIGELITDQLPFTPSRKVPLQFGTRIVTGALSGAALTASAGMLAVGAIAGAIGAVIGTLGGATFRARLAAAFGKDPPAAIIEDATAIAAALVIVGLLV